ncbi:RtcB family protein [Bacillus wiedmannii]|uniref:RtcB family protein n=1 Tax=Bacillus wiedmannii TaxID=1890302 RepID=UPI000BFB525C|nr:RtcB family protein [Bacillus wiedmannii]PHE70567.1 RNA-splicing ligase RtcB [Bacillus wiedmannii]
MIQLQGKYNSATVFTNNLEETAAGQIIDLCNQEFAKDSKIRIMPDTHAGAGCTIGTTMTIQDKVVANLVGVDIGCGMDVAIININKNEINFDQLDSVIRKYVPSGFSIRESRHKFSKLIDFRDVRAPFNLTRAQKSIGTLGGGNHFIELNQLEDGRVAIVIHSGSRNLGKSIAEHYQNLAYDVLMNVKSEQQHIIDQLKAEGREREIHDALRGIKKTKIRKELAWLEGQNFKDYMNDMAIAQNYARLNRKAMIDEIVKNMNWTIEDAFTTIHNYIDMEHMILRKGAISAQKDELVIVPINMRDGSIIATGKGNPDWNFSGPHGAGRLMSRSKAKELVSLEDFKQTMGNVWTTSVNESTLDESPYAYKPMAEILENIQDSLEVQQIIKPLYNFKAN